MNCGGTLCRLKSWLENKTRPTKNRDDSSQCDGFKALETLFYSDSMVHISSLHLRLGETEF